MTAAARRTSWHSRAITARLAPVAVIVIVLVAWEAVFWITRPPAYLFPVPSRVLAKAYQDLASGTIYPHIVATLSEVLVGFALASLAGLVFGTFLGLFEQLYKAVYPLVLAFQTIPKIALAPLFLIWFGFGPTSKIVTVATIVFFPILVNVIAGLNTIDPRRLVLMRSLGATHLQTYRKVRLPSMLPFLFAGLEIAIVFSVTGAIVAEFIGASVGLGSLIIQRQSTSDVNGVFSVLLYLSLMGLMLHAALRWVGARFTVRSPNSAASAL